MEVPFISSVNKNSPVEDVSLALNQLVKNKIDYAPWPEYPYKPKCAFTIAHADNCIFLKFFIAEDNILARFTQPNDAVYRDSCVEFFIAFNGEAGYYNLEFNCIGTCLLGYGTSRQQRDEAGNEVIGKIKNGFRLHNDQGKMKWDLTLIIPNGVFYHHDLTALSSATARANFYKCGDDLPVPHYLAWNNIESAEPNFHLTEFFGDLKFNPAG